MPTHVVIGNATLYRGDCLEILPSLNGIEAVVTDPPYGIGYVHSGSGRSMSANVNRKPIIGDDAPFDPAHLLALVNGSSRPLPILLWGADHYKTRLPDGGRFLVWDKSCGMGAVDCFVDAEFAWMNRRNARCVYRHFWKGSMRSGEDYSGNTKRAHPAQKPVELMRWCLEVARIGLGKTVLDPYMGSGSTGVACVTSGRQFIGVEIDPEYFEVACRRMAAAQGV